MKTVSEANLFDSVMIVFSSCYSVCYNLVRLVPLYFEICILIPTVNDIFAKYLPDLCAPFIHKNVPNCLI